MNKIYTAISSKRPISIPAISNHFAVSLKDEKFPSGPIVSPNPGPILARAAAAPDKEVIRSNPVSDRRTAKTPQ